MYLGYAALTNVSDGKGFELWNNHRNWVYTNRLLPGPIWLHDCTHCEGLETALYKGWAGFGYAKTFTGNDYQHPVTDPAPWVSFSPNPFPGAVPDLQTFYGFSCLSMTGVETSTRNVDFVSSVVSGAVLGKTRYAAREMVFTLVATGLDRLSVKAGIEMLALYNDVSTPADCNGQTLDLYTECPCLCDDLLNIAPADQADCEQMVKDLIATGLDRLSVKAGIEMLALYNDVSTPADCNGQTLDLYTECPCLCDDLLNIAPADQADCEQMVKDCVTPYLRRLHNVRITGGPNVLQWLDVNCGAAATFELTLTAGDPNFYLWDDKPLVVAQTDGVPFLESSPVPRRAAKERDPWTLELLPQPAHVAPRIPMPSKWYRSEFRLPPPRARSQLALRLDAIDAAPSGVRFSVLDNRKPLGSWYLKRIPEGGSVTTNLTTGELVVEYGATRQTRQDLLLAADGESPGYLWPVGGTGLSLVVDQADRGRMQVSVTAIGVL